MGFMEVALVCLGPRFPKWALDFAPTEEELAQIAEHFCEPYNVVGTAQVQISRGFAGEGGYRSRVQSWDSGPEWSATLADVAKARRIGKGPA